MTQFCSLKPIVGPRSLYSIAAHILIAHSSTCPLSLLDSSPWSPLRFVILHLHLTPGTARRPTDPALRFHTNPHPCHLATSDNSGEPPRPVQPATQNSNPQPKILPCEQLPLSLDWLWLNKQVSNRNSTRYPPNSL